MNKSSKIFLSIIMILSVILAMMTFSYLKMRGMTKENLNQVLEAAEEISKLNARISDLEEKSNISSITNVTNSSNMTMPNSNVVIGNQTVSQNEVAERKDYSIDTDKVTIEVDESTITPTSISIIITNNNENELTYGEEYKVQKNNHGKWENLEYLPNTIWNAMAYITKGNNQTTQKLNLEYTYGELRKGIYRIVKPVLNGNGGEAELYSDEFEIK